MKYAIRFLNPETVETAALSSFRKTRNSQLRRDVIQKEGGSFERIYTITCSESKSEIRDAIEPILGPYTQFFIAEISDQELTRDGFDQWLKINHRLLN